MRRLILLVILTGTILVLGSTPASAQTQITLSNSGQAVKFQVVISGTSMDIALGTCSSTTFTGTCTLSGNAAFDPGDTATYSLTTTTGSAMTVSKTATPGVFSITGATTGFSYSSTDGDSLTGTITWTNVLDGSTTPILNGVLKITAISSTAGDFTSLFGGVNSLINVNLTLNTLGCSPTLSPCTLDNVLAASTGQMASATLGHGGMTPTPEPGSLLLVGSGLVGVGFFLRRRLRV